MTFRGNVLASRYRKTSWGNAFVVQKLSSTEKNMDKKEVSRFSVEIFLSQIAEKHRERTLLSFRKFPVSKVFR